MLKVIKQRRTHRQFSDKPVEDEKIDEILKAVMFSPSATNKRAWEFIVVKDKALLDKLASMKPHSAHANKAPVVIVIVSTDWQYWVQDTSVVGEAIYLEATNQGLVTGWINVYASKTYDDTDPEAYVRKVLDIPENMRVSAFFPIGYPSINLPEHSDKEFEKLKIHHEKW